jgi:hypothetical protein
MLLKNILSYSNQFHPKLFWVSIDYFNLFYIKLFHVRLFSLFYANPPYGILGYCTFGYFWMLYKLYSTIIDNFTPKTQE